MAKDKTNNKDTLIAVRLTAYQDNQLREMAEFYKVKKSVIVRTALIKIIDAYNQQITQESTGDFY